MWTFYELKQRAKNVLRINYWQCLCAVLICTAISNIANRLIFANIGSSQLNGMSVNQIQSMSIEELEKISNAIMNNLDVLGGIFAILLVMSVIISLFVASPLAVGQNNFFCKTAKGEADIKNIFKPFTTNYLNIVKVSFFKLLILMLWGLLGVGLTIVLMLVMVFLSEFTDAVLFFTPVLVWVAYLPMIVKTYQYYMVDYILTDESGISWREALKKSKQMMNGNKLKAFGLGLSFLGWLVLGAVFFGIGTIFVVPYIQATFAELYLKLKRDADSEEYRQNYYEEI